MPAKPPATRAGKIRRAVKMRKMKKPHSPEEIQRMVEATGLSKAEVEEIIRRRNTAFVVHGTDPKAAVSIKGRGFKLEPRWAKFEMYKRFGKEHVEAVDRAFSSAKPEHFKELSRISSHYFFPSLTALKKGHGVWGRAWGKKLHFQRGGARVRARVDSSKAYVFEMAIPLNAYLLPPIDSKGESLSAEKMAGQKGFIRMAKRYWRTGIPLNVFKRYKYNRLKGIWVREPGPKSAVFWPGGPKMPLPRFYASPEVLVGEEIPTKEMRIAGKKPPRKKE